MLGDAVRTEGVALGGARDGGFHNLVADGAFVSAIWGLQKDTVVVGGHFRFFFTSMLCRYALTL